VDEDRTIMFYPHKSLEIAENFYENTQIEPISDCVKTILETDNMSSFCNTTGKRTILTKLFIYAKNKAVIATGDAKVTVSCNAGEETYFLEPDKIAMIQYSNCTINSKHGTWMAKESMVNEEQYNEHLPPTKIHNIEDEPKTNEIRRINVEDLKQQKQEILEQLNKKPEVVEAAPELYESPTFWVIVGSKFILMIILFIACFYLKCKRRAQQRMWFPDWIPSP
jgi:uncharacterized protein YgiM (DUF1202 family)